MSALVKIRLAGADPATGNANAGMLTFGDIVTRSADGIDLNDLWVEFQNVVTLFNQHKQGLVTLLTYPVTSNIEMVPMIGDLVFEEASEFGIPRAGKTNIDYYQLAYDFKDYDLKIGYTWKFLRDANAAQVQTIHTKAFDADRDLVFRKVMEALFDNRDRTARINQLMYNVYPLYNGDGLVPPKYRGKTFDGDHNHYLTTGTTALDSSDFESAVDHLTEHGYGRDTGTRIVCFANRAQVDDIITWQRGVENENSKKAKYDFVPSAERPPQFVPSGAGLLGDVPPNRWNGMIVEGSYKNVYVIEEPTMPEGYLLFLATGGPNAAENIVGVREHANEEWRGLRLLPGNQARYPLLDSYYMHGFGTGIRQRGGAVIVQVTSDTEYTIPSEFKDGEGLS